MDASIGAHAMTSLRPTRLPLSRLQLAEQQRRHLNEAEAAPLQPPRTPRRRSASAPGVMELPEPVGVSSNMRENESSATTNTDEILSAGPNPIGSPTTTAAREVLGRGRGVPEIEAILARLDYPRTVVKVVAEYHPTTTKQLLCELKKEVVRTTWAMTPIGKRRPIEALENQLRGIDRDFGFRTENMILDDVDELWRKRKTLRKIDQANAKRAANLTD